MINEISFKNFKVFKAKQTLVLRPITVLIGKNNSGKSAVLRLPTLIAAGLRGESFNWKNKVGEDSNNIVELGSNFEDLVYNRNAIFQLELGISNHNTKIEVIFLKEEGIVEYSYNGKKIDLLANKPVGLLIGGKQFDNLKLNIDYLGAIRAKPQSVYTSTNQAFDKIGIDGKNAYQILIQDFKGDNTLVNKVSEWYKTNLEGWKLQVIPVKTTETKYEVAISNSALEAINIQQTGQGIHQVLPIVVRSFIPEKEPTLIIIEEPETHLHPAAHAILAQRLVESYLEDNNKTYLLETHSQNMVLRFRRLVAEGKMSKDDLAIYYVDFDEEKNESTLKKIEVDEGGGVEWWPAGIFGETNLETRAIYNAQLNDSKNVD